MEDLVAVFMEKPNGDGWAHLVSDLHGNPGRAELRAFLKTIGIDPGQAQSATIYKAKGCPECFHTGYKGRIGIFETMVLRGGLESLVLETYDSNQIRNEALRLGMVTLRQDGNQKILQGISTIEEVLRVTET